jgi:hypothetical protein
MDALQARRVIDSGRLDQFTVQVHERDGRLAVNDRVALRIKCDVSMPRGMDIEVFADDKTLLGVLCFTSNETGDYQNTTEYRLAAYLTELQPEEFDLARSLRDDYIVIDKGLVTEYLQEYASSSAIWGGFVHIGNSDRICTRVAPFIEAYKGMRLPLDTSEVLCRRAIFAAHPFERFLKHYHQLELLVDWHVAKRISRLPNDLNGFDKIMSAYGAGDLVRIKDLVSTFCTNPQEIRGKMAAANQFMATSTSMFQEFGKPGNPLSSAGWEKWKAGTIAEKEILDTAAYWIFRVRCSIAHHRVGEYLIKESDEEFIVSFAEPLLLAVIRQVLSNNRLQQLI